MRVTGWDGVQVVVVVIAVVAAVDVVAVVVAAVVVLVAVLVAKAFLALLPDAVQKALVGQWIVVVLNWRRAWLARGRVITDPLLLTLQPIEELGETF